MQHDSLLFHRFQFQPYDFLFSWCDLQGHVFKYPLHDFNVISKSSVFQKNVGVVDTHVSDYQRMIDSLQVVC